MAQGADALGNQVERGPLLGVLLLEQQVQRLEHGAGNVPVKIVRLHIQRETVSHQPRETRADGLALLVADADVDFGRAHVRLSSRWPAPAKEDSPAAIRQL